MIPVTVIIPVGPELHHQKYLEECLASVRAQTHPVDEILLIDDMANLSPENTGLGSCTIWRTPWRLGAAGAINCGISLAKNELVYILCGDDWLEPECIAACVREYARRKDPLGYYHVTVRFKIQEGYEDQPHLPPGLIKDLPSGAALVTKQLWKHTGGFPADSSMSPDAIFISILYGKKGSGNMYHVRQGEPLCNIRMHGEQDSAGRGSWASVINLARHLLTLEWKQPNWGRYE